MNSSIPTNSKTRCLDMGLNRVPESVKSVHFIAACGTGMGALAGMLKELGYHVSGSDQNVYPPMSDFLAGKGIEVARGFSPQNLSHCPDLVIVGNAVSRDNPEVEAMIETGRCFCSMPQAINRLVAAGRKQIVVTGTHGKTTTAALMAWVLQVAGLDPGFMIGGIVKNFNSNYRIGGGDFFVVEGDEYDTAFFDKGPKFLHYPPAVAILTSVEFDHADIYRDLEHVKSAFDRFVSGMAPASTLLACDHDPVIDELITGAHCRVARYGQRGGSYWQLDGFGPNPPWSEFEVRKQDGFYADFKAQLMGKHNLMNALAVVGAADTVGISPKAVKAAFESFKGVKRRQERRGEKRGVTVLDDFAHHPTAVRETVRAVRPFFPQGRLIAVFEPRTNTSMRNVFQAVYAEAFDAADLICIRKPPLLKKVPPAERFSSEKLVSDLKRRGKDARFFPDTDGIIGYLAEEAQAGDVILVMSNGGFDNIHDRLLKSL